MKKMPKSNICTTTIIAFAVQKACAVLFLFSGGLAAAADGMWINASGGSWTATANWSSGAVADGSGSTADFSALDLAADVTVTLDSSRTIGNLVFDDITPTHNWLLNAGATGELTLAVPAGMPTIKVNNQTATLGAFLYGTNGLAKTGSGTLVLAGIESITGNVMVNQGALRLTGFLPAGAPVTVNPGGTLSGSGTMNGSVNVNGMLAPDTFSFIPMTVNGSLSLARAPFLLAAGDSHVLVIKDDGTLAAWGDNTYGQCSIPSGLGGVMAVAAGGLHSVVLKPDGTVAAWGDNTSGQCSIPSGLGGVIAVAAGSAHSVALKSDGTVVAWGDNTYGQCSVPSDLSGVKAVAAGHDHTVALKNDGTVVAWGAGDQCLVPDGLTGVKAIAAGYNHTVALKTDGTVVAWGSESDFGQAPVPDGLCGVTAVAAGYCCSLALKADGSVAVWGNDQNAVSSVPAGLANVVAVAAGLEYTVFLKGDGTLVAGGFDIPAGVKGLVPVTQMRIHKSGTALECDKIQGMASVAYGGVLKVTAAGDALATGDVFQLFSAAAYAGSFASFDLPALTAGLTWDTSGLAVDGSIAVKNAQVVTFEEIPDHQYGDGLVVLNATASSGLPVTYTSSNPDIAAIMDGNTVCVNAAGRVVITATQAGNATWAPASASRVLNVGAVATTLAATSVSAGDVMLNGTVFAAGEDTWVIFEYGTNAGYGSAVSAIPSPVNIRDTVPVSVALNGLVPGTTYHFRVKATNSFCSTYGADRTFTTPFAWINAGGGSWTATANWSSGAVADGSGSTADFSALDLTADATVMLDGARTVGTLTFGDTLPSHDWFLNAGTGGALTLNMSAGRPAIMVGNQTTTINASLAGTQGLIKYGTGTLVLAGSNSLTGEVLVNEGILRVDGSLPVGAPVKVGSAGMLSGTGTVNDSVTVNGTLAPGGVSAAGTMAVNGDLVLTQSAGVLAAGWGSSAVVKGDGTVVVWGFSAGLAAEPEGLCGVTALAVGGGQVLAVTGGGAAVGWGDGAYGQGTIPNGLVNVKAVAAGCDHSVALRHDGTVVAWGSNDNGQCTIPEGLAGVTAIAAGDCHTAALKNDGTVTAWGLAGTVPEGLCNVKAIAAGSVHTLALKTDGTVVAWGDDSFGQCMVPNGLTGVVAVAAVGSHSLALKADGTVVAWGDNTYGQCTIPAGLANVKAVAAGGYHSLALKADGTLLAWGDNTYGQCDIPAGVKGLVPVTQMRIHKSGTALECDKIQGMASVAYGGVLKVTAAGDALAAGDTCQLFSAAARAGSFGELVLPALAEGLFWETSGLAADGSIMVRGTQTITFDSLTAKTYGDAAFALTATASSGLAVTYTSSNPSVATVSGGTVTIVGAGTATITASQAGNASYCAAADVAQTLTVAKASQTITFGALPAKSLGDAAFDLTATASSGLPVTYTSSNTNVATVSGCTLTLANVGETTITASQEGDANYNPAADVSQTLTVNFAGPVATTVEATGVGRTTATLNGMFVAGSDDARVYFEYGLDTNYGSLVGCTPFVVGFGTSSAASAILEGLLPGTTYHYRAWAENWASESYGEDRTFTTASPSTAVWINAAGGSWVNSANWLGGLIGNCADDTADFSTLDLTADATVTLDGALTIGHLKFGDTTASHNWYLYGGDACPLTLDVAAGMPTITVNNQLVTIDGALVGTKGLAKAGTGTLELTGNNWPGGSVDIREGVLMLSCCGTLSQGISVTVNPAGTLADNGGGIAGSVVMNGRLAPSSLIITGSLSLAPAPLLLTAGDSCAAALKDDGTLAVWGDNSSGQCTIPGGLGGVTAIAAGGMHVAALKADGTVVAWGDNSSGQCNVPQGLAGVTAIAAGYAHTVALKNDGTIVAWGDNSYGQCTVPEGLAGVTAVAAGVGSTVVLKNDGTVMAWGEETYGSCLVPEGLNDVKAIVAGYYYAAALKNDGTIVEWGFDYYGQAYAGPEGLSGVKSLAMGVRHTVALKGDGTVVAWGSNDQGQCDVPEGLSGVVAIEAGPFYTVALKGDGTLVAWGWDCNCGSCSIPSGLKAFVPVTQMKIQKTGTAVGSDKIYGMASVTYGGVLEVTATGDTLKLGDTFQLFSAVAYAGTFAGFLLPELPAGLAWDTSGLAVDGSIKVVGQPAEPGQVAAEDALTSQQAALFGVGSTEGADPALEALIGRNPLVPAVVVPAGTVDLKLYTPKAN